MTAVPTCLRIYGMIRVGLGTDICGGTFAAIRANFLLFFFQEVLDCGPRFISHSLQLNITFTMIQTTNVSHLLYFFFSLESNLFILFLNCFITYQVHKPQNFFFIDTRTCPHFYLLLLFQFFIPQNYLLCKGAMSLAVLQ